MELARKLIPVVRKTMLEALVKRCRTAVDDGCAHLGHQSMTQSDADKLAMAKDQVITRFSENLARSFDALIDAKQLKSSLADYGSLSLLEESDLEAMIAIEGMIAHARNCDISEYLAFSTRLNSLFVGIRIDESNNPMDPEQIAEAFSKALRPLNLSGESLLELYRQFNMRVFGDLEGILQEANELLISAGVLENLNINARSSDVIRNRRGQARSRQTPEQRAFDEQQSGDGAAPPRPVFSIVQRLIQQKSQSSSAEGTAAAAGQAIDYSGGGFHGLQPGMMIAGKTLAVVSLHELQDLLGRVETDAAEAQRVTLGQQVARLLERESGSDTLKALDAQSTDIVSLTSLLFEVIAANETMPEALRELLCGTRLAVLAIALRDPTFFDQPGHPARCLLNELAAAGIPWITTARLENDPLFQQMRKVVAGFKALDPEDLQAMAVLTRDFLHFKEQEKAREQDDTSRLADADARRERVEEIKDYARRKIHERILEVDTPVGVKDFFDNCFHPFVVEVILREGPGGSSWKSVMNTVDVLLWTTSGQRSEAERSRYHKVNPRLMVNLKKALQVARIDEAEAGRALQQLQSLQEECFSRQADGNGTVPGSEDSFDSWLESAVDEARRHDRDLAEDDEHLREVTDYPVGIWLDFAVDREHSMRCTLAAKIASIDKYIFVNNQGVKILEKSRVGLARELKAGSVKVISESPLIDCAMETVISRLRAQAFA